MKYARQSTVGLLFMLALWGQILLVSTPAISGQPPYSYLYTSLPACSAERVLEKIVRRFNKADASLWYNGVQLDNIDGAYERAYNIYPDSSINRRYCRGKAYMSNGRSRMVYFVVEQGMGLAGYGWNVEYCLKGSDRWNAYNGWCRVLRK